MSEVQTSIANDISPVHVIKRTSPKDFGHNIPLLSGLSYPTQSAQIFAFNLHFFLYIQLCLAAFEIAAA